MHHTTIRRLALTLAMGLAAAAPARADEPKQTLMPENAEIRALYAELGLSDAVVHGDTIHLSGVVAGLAPGEQSLTPAYERAFAHIDGILKRLGASWDDVIVFDTFHKGPMREQIDALMPVKKRYIREPFPAWTAVGVTELFDPAAVTEIKLTVRRR
jgi:enamine deaminase RidA (YjgF/YER057c/UK114 family)